MPKSFDKAGPEVMKFVEEATAKWHPDLAANDVRIAVLMVEPAKTEDGEPTGHVITVNRQPAAACIRILPIKTRIISGKDVLIEIDSDKWHSLTSNQSLALIDHELTHLEVEKDDEGQVIMTEDLRPKLKSIPDEIAITGFMSVIKRHGIDALEAQNIREVVDQCQLVFDFVEA